MNEIAEHVRKNLKIARKELGITQGELADKLGCSKMAVTQWECGTREVRYDALVQLSSVLGRSWLWFYQDHSPAAQVSLNEGLPESQNQSEAWREFQEFYRWKQLRGTGRSSVMNELTKS